MIEIADERLLECYRNEAKCLRGVLEMRLGWAGNFEKIRKGIFSQREIVFPAEFISGGTA